MSVFGVFLRDSTSQRVQLLLSDLFWFFGGSLKIQDKIQGGEAGVANLRSKIKSFASY